MKEAAHSSKICLFIRYICASFDSSIYDIMLVQINLSFTPLGCKDIDRD